MVPSAGSCTPTEPRMGVAPCRSVVGGSDMGSSLGKRVHLAPSLTVTYTSAPAPSPDGPNLATSKSSLTSRLLTIFKGGNAPCGVSGVKLGAAVERSEPAETGAATAGVRGGAFNSAGGGVSESEAPGGVGELGGGIMPPEDIVCRLASVPAGAFCMVGITPNDVFSLP